MDHKRIGPLQQARGGIRAAAHIVAARTRLAGFSLYRLAAFLLLPHSVVLAMLVSGFACTVLAVWMLAGTAWCLLAAGSILFTLAGLALRGMLNG